MFITLFTTVRYLYLLLYILIHSTLPYYFFKIHFNIINPSTPSSFEWCNPPQVLHSPFISSANIAGSPVKTLPKHSRRQQLSYATAITYKQRDCSAPDGVSQKHTCWGSNGCYQSKGNCLKSYSGGAAMDLWSGDDQFEHRQYGSVATSEIHKGV